MAEVAAQLRAEREAEQARAARLQRWAVLGRWYGENQYPFRELLPRAEADGPDAADVFAAAFAEWTP
jgi:hypothetical protein